MVQIEDEIPVFLHGDVRVMLNEEKVPVVPTDKEFPVVPDENRNPVVRTEYGVPVVPNEDGVLVVLMEDEIPAAPPESVILVVLTVNGIPFDKPVVGMDHYQVRVVPTDDNQIPVVVIEGGILDHNMLLNKD